MKLLELNQKTIEELSEYKGFPALSFYMSTHATHKEEVDQDKIRLKNLIQIAEKQLKDQNYHLEKDSLISEVKTFQEHHEFWKTSAKALAIFTSEDVSKVLLLPESVDESVSVTDNFLISPALGMLVENQEFYLATISRKTNHLYHGDNSSLDELEDVELPGPMEEELGIEDYEYEKQYNPLGVGVASFHGHGGSNDGKDAMRENYFRMVARTVDARLKGVATEPLIIAGSEKDISYFKKISTYPHISEETITGNFENFNKEDLLERANEITRSYFIDANHESIEQYLMADSKEPEKTSTSPEEIAIAGEEGRVSRLFVRFNETTQDNNKKQLEKVDRYITDASTNGQIIEKAITNSWKNGAEIVPISRGDINEEARVAALYRY